MPRKTLAPAAAAAETEVLERSEHDEGAAGSEQPDSLSTISEGEDVKDSSILIDPDRDEKVVRLVAYGYSQEEANAVGYYFSRSATATELTAAQVTMLAAARAVKSDKPLLRASAAPFLKSERLDYSLLKAILEYHNTKFPGGNLAAMISLSPEGIMQLRGVPLAPSGALSNKFQFRKRPTASAGGARSTRHC